MDEHLDTSWCPVCDKLILPKRYTVAADLPPPQQASPNPNQRSSPIPPSLSRQNSARAKSGALLRALARNQGGGLLHGTGRIRPGGGLKRTASSNAVVASSQALQQLQPVPAVHPAMIPRERVVIDQGQTPLYCSDKCRKEDLELANISLSRSAPSDPLPLLQVQETVRGLGMHPSQLNPAVASPPSAQSHAPTRSTQFVPCYLEYPPCADRPQAQSLGSRRKRQQLECHWLRRQYGLCHESRDRE